MQAQHEEKLSLIRHLEAARAEGEAWRREAQQHVAGLGAAIDRQFESWGLTAAEREIGSLMLKGLSHKEIAIVRGTSDPTVRHQATTIYQKAGVESRTAFCAFFLEDLLPANGGGVASPVAGGSSPDRFQTPTRR
jgi:DNA-binding NarL/FixJ family response regulator